MFHIARHVLTRRALEIKEKQSADLDTANMLTELCLCVRGTGRPEKAERYARRVLHITETELGPDDPKIADTLQLLASCLKDTGKGKEAERCVARANEITDTVPNACDLI